MTKRPKAPPPQSQNPQPHMTEHVEPGVADEKSSKATSKTHDPRTAQDKDGNEQHPKDAP